jgi:hypothetical protein
MTSDGRRSRVGGDALRGSVRSRAKIRQNHNSWYLMDVEEPLHLVGWRET